MRELERHEFTRILSIVQSYCSPELDTENIAQNVWMESLDKDHPPTRYEIRARCIDAIRRYHRDDKKLRAYKTVGRRNDRNNTVQDTLHRIISVAELSPEEKDVIVRKFYSGQNLGQIALDMRRSMVWVGETLWTAMDKLRSAKRREGL